MLDGLPQLVLLRGQGAGESVDDAEVRMIERQDRIGAETFRDGDHRGVHKSEIGVGILSIDCDRAREDVLGDRLGDEGTRVEVREEAPSGLEPNTAP